MWLRYCAGCFSAAAGPCTKYNMTATRLGCKSLRPLNLVTCRLLFRFPKAACTKCGAVLTPHQQFAQRTVVQPNHAAQQIQERGRERIGFAHLRQGLRISPRPIRPINAVHTQLQQKQRQRQQLPTPPRHNARADGRAEISPHAHNQADGNVSIRCRLPIRTRNQKGNAARQREQFPRAAIIVQRNQRLHCAMSSAAYSATAKYCGGTSSVSQT